ncbi:MAG: monosaccharide transporter rane protein family [Chloroflexi bacterium]|jgi:ribose transport system permease protein|nr:monosaccharide transporter rane protein family [Chloroflexota bacterium]
MSAPTVENRRGRISLGTRLRYYAAQNVPLLLSLGLLIVMIVLYYVFFTRRQGHAPGNFELTTTANNTLTTGLAAIGQTLVVLTGGIDLSIGGIIDLTNAFAARYMGTSTASIVGVSLLVLLIGTGAGLINGLLVAYGRLQPIVVTLATLAIFQGLAIEILPTPGGQIPPNYTTLLSGTIPSLGQLPNSLVILVLLILLWQLLRRTPFMVTLYAIGNDARAARANGAPILRARLGAFALSGFFSGAAGLYFVVVNTSGDPASGDGFTLTSIAAVVLGGVSLFGGRGSAVGALAGAFILNLILIVLFFTSIDQEYTDLFQGLFLILAVVASTLVGRLLQRGR